MSRILLHLTGVLWIAELSIEQHVFYLIPGTYTLRGQHLPGLHHRLWDSQRVRDPARAGGWSLRHDCHRRHPHRDTLQGQRLPRAQARLVQRKIDRLMINAVCFIVHLIHYRTPRELIWITPRFMLTRTDLCTLWALRSQIPTNTFAGNCLNDFNNLDGNGNFNLISELQMDTASQS